MGVSWDTVERKMGEVMANDVAYMEGNNKFLMKMNALQQQSQVEEFCYAY